MSPPRDDNYELERVRSSEGKNLAGDFGIPIIIDYNVNVSFNSI